MEIYTVAATPLASCKLMWSYGHFCNHVFLRLYPCITLCSFAVGFGHHFAITPPFLMNWISTFHAMSSQPFEFHAVSWTHCLPDTGIVTPALSPSSVIITSIKEIWVCDTPCASQTRLCKKEMPSFRPSHPWATTQSQNEAGSRSHAVELCDKEKRRLEKSDFTEAPDWCQTLKPQ